MDFNFNIPHWHKNALCRDHPWELWFPKKGQSNKEAKEICYRCTVFDKCFHWIIHEVRQDKDITGIFAGMNNEERRKYRRESEEAKANRGTEDSVGEQQRSHEECS